MVTHACLQFLALFACCALFAVDAAQQPQPARPTLHLLALVPLAEHAVLSSQPSYHRGEELLSAAQLAVDKINMRDDILPGYNLELVPANSETCNQSLVTEAPVNFVRQVTDENLSIVGVVGLLCSTVTQAVSPLAGRPEIDLLQISAGAISPVFINENEYPHLYRMISSSAVYNNAVLKLMATFQWGNIIMVRDTILIQHTTTADDFVSKVEGRTDLELVFLGEVTPTFPTSPVQNLLSMRARTIYASVTASEARELLCESYQTQVNFVWLFHDLTIEDLTLHTASCDNETMVRAVEGSFFLRYRLQPNPNMTLVSGQTYTEYLMELQDRMNGTQENHHADALHDSIWAFALALNNSIPGLDTSNVTTSLEWNLRDVYFYGTLGEISFNEEREVVTEVDIFHVREGVEIYAGRYNPITGNITVQLPPERIPRDDFERVVVSISRAFPIVVYIIVATELVFTTVVLALFIYYWNMPLIKATTRFLSLLILAGCYMMHISALVVATTEFLPDEFFGSSCQFEIWCTAIAVQLIYSTLFMRLLRVYRIFFYRVFDKPGTIFSNRAILVQIFIPVSVTILLLILWTSLEPAYTDFVPVSAQTSGPLLSAKICGGANFPTWAITIVYGVNGITILAVAVIATLTRKVRLDCFKDSKEVNSFVFSTVLCLLIWLPYTITFSLGIPIAEASFCFGVFPYIVIPFLCQVFLFLPKIWLSRHEGRRAWVMDKRRSTASTYSFRRSSHPSSPNTQTTTTATNGHTCIRVSNTFEY